MHFLTSPSLNLLFNACFAISCYFKTIIQSPPIRKSDSAGNGWFDFFVVIRAALQQTTEFHDDTATVLRCKDINIMCLSIKPVTRGSVQREALGTLTTTSLACPPHIYLLISDAHLKKLCCSNVGSSH